jgi:hypothetical protein
MLRLIAIACSILTLAACSPRDRNTWHPAPPGGVSSARMPRPDEPAPRRTAVVFAPVAIGELAETWPAASLSFAYDLADRIDVLGSKADADGLAGADLPVSDDAAWRAWPVEGTRGADLVVLTVVQSITLREDAANSQGQRRIVATVMVEMRALDTYGNVVFAKRGRGDWEGFPSPKFPGPEAKPQTRTTWEACSNAVGALLDFLEKRNEAVAEGPAPTAEQLIEVEIASDPPGADVLIDGIFRGNTPCTLKLPARRLPIRLERQGYAPWERVTIPDQGMKIRPALDKTGG